MTWVAIIWQKAVHMQAYDVAIKKIIFSRLWPVVHIGNLILYTLIISDENRPD